MRYFVYLITNITGEVIYTVVTNNLLRRVYEHKQKLVKGFTSKYKVDKLVYYEEYGDIRDAIQREKQLKGGSRLKKVRLIKDSNPNWKDLYEELI